MQTLQTQLAGRYAIEGRMSHAGPVELYSALDQQLQRPVTIQVLSEAAAQDPTLSARFLKHQQLAATMHHPSVLEVYDAGEWHERPFSVMERATGAPAAAIVNGSAAPPDLALALKVTRQAAEAVQYCRDNGFADWRFSPDLVTVDAAGNAHISLLEHPEREDGVPRDGLNNASDDPAALGNVLRVMLAGEQATSSYPRQLPKSVLDLLDLLTSGKAGAAGITTAGEVAQAIAALEASFADPTQAHPAVAEAASNGSASPYGAVNPAEAPTEVAQVMPAVPVNAGATTAIPASDATQGAVGYLPATEARGYGTRKRTRRNLLPIITPALALLLLGLLAAAMWPKANAEVSAEQPPPSAPTTVPLVVVPDLRGKELGQARNESEVAGLALNVGDRVYAESYPIDTIAAQDPAPGSEIVVGSAVTVSMSLGPEGNPLAPAPPESEATTQPSSNPQPQPPGQSGQEKKDNEDKDADKDNEDKDADKDKENKDRNKDN